MHPENGTAGKAGNSAHLLPTGRFGSITGLSQVVADWGQLVSKLFPESSGEGVAALRALGAQGVGQGAGQPGAEQFLMGSMSRFQYRLEPGFSVDRPHGVGKVADDDGHLHRSVHFKAKHGNHFWDHLALITGALFACDALLRRRDGPGSDLTSAEAVALEAKGLAVNQFLEGVLFGTVNLFAQIQIARESLVRQENELRILEELLDQQELWRQAGLPACGGSKPMIARELATLEILVEEKFAEAEGNRSDSLRLMGLN